MFRVRRRLVSSLSTSEPRAASSLLAALPARVPLTLVRSPPPRDAPLDGLATPGTGPGVPVPAVDGSLATLYWAERRPRTAAVVWVNRKEREVVQCARLVAYMEGVLGLNVLVPRAVAPLVGGTPYDPDDAAGLARTVDFAVTIGNYDARAALSALFAGAMPPVLAITRRLHSEKGLDDLWRRVCVMLRSVCAGGFGVMDRLRLVLTVSRPGGARNSEITFLHDVVLHRAPHPTSVRLNLFLGAHFLTPVTTDGIVVATPSGSTGYSRTAGGALVHPSLHCFQISPINAQTLSFRPLVIPDDTVLRIQVDSGRVRRPLTLTVDGCDVAITADDELQFKRSPFPFPSVRI